jgi:hypothetical protein
MKEDWRGLDDDGRSFLAQALGQSSPVDEPQTHAAHDLLPAQLESLEDALESSDENASPLLELLEAAVHSGASDLHLSAGGVPHLRVHGVRRGTHI